MDQYGFLLTPYRKVKSGKVTGKVEYLRADEEMQAVFAPPSVLSSSSPGGKIKNGLVLARKGGELAHVLSDEVGYIDISPKQIVGVSASLIPFLEHDDANRALMGSNMQRQAVPLLKTEPPFVGTGMEEVVGQNSSMVVRAENSGVVTAVDSTKIVINHTDEYKLKKFEGLNERTCLNQKPIVSLGDRVKAGQILQMVAVRPRVSWLSVKMCWWGLFLLTDLTLKMRLLSVKNCARTIALPAFTLTSLQLRFVKPAWARKNLLVIFPILAKRHCETLMKGE